MGSHRLSLPEDLPEGLHGFCERLSRLAGLGMVSSMIMHEIRNALTVISGNAQIILFKEGDVPRDDLVRRLEQIMAQIDRIMETIERVGGFAERSYGELVDHLPGAALDNALGALTRRLNAAGIKVERSQVSGTRPLFCDASLFEFLLIELVEAVTIGVERDGRVALDAHDSDDCWELNVRIVSGGVKEEPLLALADLGGSFRLVPAMLVVEGLGAELTLLSGAEETGFRLRVPWAQRADQDNNQGKTDGL